MPPSEKESGVMFNIPMMMDRCAEQREKPVAALDHGETIDLRDGSPASVNHWLDNP